MEKEKATSVSPKIKKGTIVLASGVGRRKSSVARVWVSKGKGNILVNNRNVDSYFDTEIARLAARSPFKVCSDVATSYDVKINIFGGGQCSQAGAVKLGLARALVKIDPELRPTLKKNKMLSVDSRVKERKKYGQRGARRKFQFVKR